MFTHVIGDIHGCHNELCDLLDRLAPASDDRLVFVGDLVVRGPENARVVRRFLDGDLAGATVLLGNNEVKLKPTLAGDPTYATPHVFFAIDQLRTDGILDEALDLFDSFPLFADLGDTAVVHAGVRPGIALRDQAREDLIKMKTIDGTPQTPMWWDVYPGPQRIVYGHHVTREPFVLPHSIGIDTGCVYGGHLTAYTLETGTFTSVRARATYYRHPGKHYLFE